MKLKVDKESDALYFRLDESEVVESEEVQPGVILDFSAEGKVVGIEMLKKYLKYDQETAEAGYKEFVKSFAEDGRLPVKGFEFLLAEEEKAGKLKEKTSVADLIDESLVQFFKQAR